VNVLDFPSPTPAQTTPSVVIVTGMSGAGRTQVAKVLEDLDYFVIDNLPPALFDKVVELAFGPGSSVDRFAVVADVRGREFFGSLVQAVHELRDSEATIRVVFLEANDDALVSRFEATRRRHPAEIEGGGVLDGIRREREMLAELRGMADLILDTSDLNVHELRDRVVVALGDPEQALLTVKLVSFGFKYGTPRDADVVMDVRFLPNPHWVEALRPFNGTDEPVREYVLKAAADWLPRFNDLLDVTVPGYLDEGKRYLTIAIGCTGGKHRSVAISEAVAQHLRDTHQLPVHVSHVHLGSE
jgi:UPF0042 nucleotide-binding protein